MTAVGRKRRREQGNRGNIDSMPDFYVKIKPPKIPALRICMRQVRATTGHLACQEKLAQVGSSLRN